MTTLTKQALLSAGKARYEEVEIDGLGTIGIQSVSELKQSRRDSSAVDGSGNVKEGFRDRVRARAIIDQVCSAPGKPLFTDDDIDEVLSLDHAVTRKLFAAVQVFNGEDDAKKKAESNGSPAN